MASYRCTAYLGSVVRPPCCAAILLLLVGLGLSWLPSVAWAGSTTFGATADASVWAKSGFQNENYGTLSDILVGPESGSLWYSYVKFNPSGIDSDTVQSATMRIRVHGMSYLDDQSQHIVVELVTGSWTETGVTYSTRPATGTQLDAVDVNGWGWVEIDIPLSTIRSWIDSPSQNRGVELRATNMSGAMYQFGTREGSESYRPELVVEYTAPSDPKVWQMGIPSEAQVDEPFTFSVYLANESGAAAPDGKRTFLDVSIRDNADEYADPLVDITQLSSRFDDAQVYLPGSTLWKRSGTTMTSYYPLVEGEDADYTPSGGHTDFRLGITVVPRQPGTLRIQYRGTICELGTYTPEGIDPTDAESSAIDQQDWPVYYQTVTVNPAPAPVITDIDPNAAGVGQDGIRIQGSHFGDVEGTVKFHSNRIAAVQSWSNTAIECTVPSGASTGDVTVITYAGQTSNGYAYTVPEFTVTVDGITDTGGASRSVFQPGQTVRVTLYGANAQTPVDAVGVLNIRDPNDTVVYDSNTQGENVTRSAVGSGGAYFTFDYTLPSSAPTGSYDILGALRGGAYGTDEWSSVYDDTQSGANTRTVGESAWVLAAFEVAAAPALLEIDDFDWRLTPGVSLTIAGTVRDEGGNPLAGVDIGVENSILMQSLGRVDTTHANGRFSYTVTPTLAQPAGLYAFTFYAAYGGDCYSLVTMAVNPAGDYTFDIANFTVDTGVLGATDLGLGTKLVAQQLPNQAHIGEITSEERMWQAKNLAVNYYQETRYKTVATLHEMGRDPACYGAVISGLGAYMGVPGASHAFGVLGKSCALTGIRANLHATVLLSDLPNDVKQDVDEAIDDLALAHTILTFKPDGSTVELLDGLYHLIAGLVEVQSRVEGQVSDVVLVSADEDGYVQVVRVWDPRELELEVYRCSDTTGTANTASPGTARSTFLAGETARITLRARNTGPDSVDCNWVLNVAQASQHDADPLPFNSDPQANNTNNGTVPPDGEWHYLSFDWVLDTTEAPGDYDILGALRSAANWDDVLDDTQAGASTRSFGSSAWLTGLLDVTSPASVTFEVTTANSSAHTDLDASNHVVVTYEKPDGSSGTVEVYDGHPETAYAKPSSEYSFGHTSTGSGATHRWVCGDTLTGTVPASGSDTASRDYYDQYKPTVTLAGTDSSHTVSCEYRYLGAEQQPSGRQGTWSAWCDAGGGLIFDEATIGDPPRVTTDERSWIVDSAFAKTITYIGHTVEITAGPSATPDAVAPGGTANCTVTAEDSCDHDLTYAWTAKDGSGTAAGSFDDPTAPEPVWTAPQNLTGNAADYTLEVTVTCAEDTSVSDAGSTTVTVWAAPALEWAGGTGYANDGCEPNVGAADGTCTFKVRYTDPSGESPVKARLIIAKRVCKQWKLFKNLALTLESGDIATGAVYSASVDMPNLIYKHRFLFKTASGTSVAGPPNGYKHLPMVEGTPFLCWAGQPGFENDGVSPDAGPVKSKFKYMVLYQDSVGDIPGTRNVIVQRDGAPYKTKAMTTYASGSYRLIKYYVTTLWIYHTGSYEYRFHFADPTGDATGDPASFTAGPTITTGDSAASLGAQLTGLVGVPTPTGVQLTFTLSSNATITASVRNIAGRPVRTLAVDKPMVGGRQTLLWDRRADTGLPVPPGIYLVEATTHAEDGAQSRALATVTLR